MMSPGITQTWLRRLRDASPLIALALLLTLPAVFPDESETDEQSEQRNARIARIIDAIPWRIGSWRGELVPVPAAAEDVLNPNAVLSRRYRKLNSGQEAILLIVHCSDTRDMLGHYPPLCYPSNGWLQDGEWTHDFADAVAWSSTFEVREYCFYRNSGWGSRNEIRIFNFFMLPDGRVANRLDELRDMAGRTFTSKQGVVQVQLVIQRSMSEAQRREAFDELIGGIDQTLASFGNKES